MKPCAIGGSLLGCIDKDIGVGGSYHRRSIIFAVLFFQSCRRDFKFLRAKKESQEAFDDEIN
jgi:hypothetical protein